MDHVIWKVLYKCFALFVATWFSFSHFYIESQTASPTQGNKSTRFYAKVSVDLGDLISWNHCTVIRYSLQDLDTVLVLASPIFTTNLIKCASLWFNALNGLVFCGQNHRTFLSGFDCM